MATVAGAVCSGASSTSRTRVAPGPPTLTNDTSDMTDEQRKRMEEAREREDEAGEPIRTMGKYEEKKGKIGKITKKPCYIIDPRSSKFVPWWDAIGTVRTPSRRRLRPC